jgi:hypothetical protein
LRWEIGLALVGAATVCRFPWLGRWSGVVYQMGDFDGWVIPFPCFFDFYFRRFEFRLRGLGSLGRYLAAVIIVTITVVPDID